MWPFKKPVVDVTRSKNLDWSKVKTVEDLVSILSHTGAFRNMKVDESLWSDPHYAKFTGTKITEVTYVNGMRMSEKEYDQQPESNSE